MYVVSAVKRASEKSSAAPPKMLIMRIERGTSHAPRRGLPENTLMMRVVLVDTLGGPGIDADPELGFLLRRVLAGRS